MTNIKKYAYIELIFSEEEKKYFSDVITKLVSKDQLYYSPVMPHIKGDVTESLHCTLFFGINPDLVNDKTLTNIVSDSSEFDEIELGKLVLFNGYQGLYKILCIEIVNEDNKFSKFAKKIEDFINDEDIEYEVKPHMTLAYVVPEYEITDCPENMIKKLKSKKIQISIQE